MYIKETYVPAIWSFSSLALVLLNACYMPCDLPDTLTDVRFTTPPNMSKKSDDQGITEFRVLLLYTIVLVSTPSITNCKSF